MERSPPRTERATTSKTLAPYTRLPYPHRMDGPVKPGHDEENHISQRRKTPESL